MIFPVNTRIYYEIEHFLAEIIGKLDETWTQLSKQRLEWQNHIMLSITLIS